MIQDFFLELAAVIIVATLLGFLFKKLKQPILLAFIFAGILLGSSFLNVITYKELMQVFSELGVAFLLFLVGINLDLRIFREIGKTSIITGLGQIVFTTIVGFGIASFLGFGFLESMYIAIALTFSSTIIIVKLLSDKKELNSLYGKTYQTIRLTDYEEEPNIVWDEQRNKAVRNEVVYRAGGIYLPHIGSWITAICRAKLHQDMHKYKAIDCATDSFKTAMTIPEGKGLGELKLESEGLLLSHPPVYI